MSGPMGFKGEKGNFSLVVCKLNLSYCKLYYCSVVVVVIEQKTTVKHKNVITANVPFVETVLAFGRFS